MTQELSKQALRELELAQDTIVAFASTPGPRRGGAPIWRGLLDMGSPGPFRDANEGSIRTAALMHWLGRIGP
jgi:hypothetical protein